MADLVLIHGNATGIEFSVFGRDQKYADFTAFKTQIDSGQSKLYRWHYINHKYNIFDTFFNVFKFARLYYEERNFCSSLHALNQLHHFLHTEQPKIILGHSLGAYQILNYLNQHDLPESVKKVIFVQGAFPAKKNITNTKLIDKIIHNELEIQNFHSSLDQMLWVYTLAHLHKPGGLFGTRNKYIKDIKFTHIQKGNPHLWTIQSNQFRDLVLTK